MKFLKGFSISLSISGLMLSFLIALGSVTVTFLPNALNPYSLVTSKYKPEINWAKKTLSHMQLQCNDSVSLEIYQNPIAL